MDATLSLADHVLHCSCVLECRRRGAVRLPNQSAAAAVLHARAQPHAAAWPHSTVRCLWSVRCRADVVLSAWTQAERSVEREAAEDELLGLQHRSCRDGAADVAADWAD